MHSSEDSQKSSSSYAWFIWGLGALFYFYEFVVRVAPSIMRPELQAAFAVDVVALSGAIATYYYSYAALQLVIGVLLDRFGPRGVLILSSGLLTLGCFLAVQAQALVPFAIGRFLQGAGSAVGFIGVLYLGSMWFPKNKMARIAGFTNALGMLGAMIGQEFLAVVVDSEGYRKAFWVCTIAGLVVTVLLWVFTPERVQEELDPAMPPPVNGWAPLGLITVIKNPQTWIISIVASCLYVCLPAFVELLGVDYLIKKTGHNRAWASTATSMVYLGWLIGGPLAGWFSDFLGRRKVLLQISLLLTGLLFLVLLYAPASLDGTLVYALLFLAGCVSSIEVICFVAAFECNPYAYRGAAMAVANMLVMVFGGLAQPAVALLLDTVSRVRGHVSPDVLDYQFALLFIPAATGLGFLVSLFMRESSHVAVSKSDSEKYPAVSDGNSLSCSNAHR